MSVSSIKLKVNSKMLTKHTICGAKIQIIFHVSIKLFGKSFNIMTF